MNCTRAFTLAFPFHTCARRQFFLQQPRWSVSTLRFFRTRDMSVRDMTGEFSIAYVTVPSREAGKAIAADIIEKKLAACVNIIPGVESLYWWEGKMESSNELMMMIKTRTSLVPQLVERVKAMHEYDVCEVITSPIDAGNPAYMKWLDESTAKV
mmetsp:Transcript_35778/g.93262  ORF Transcript_35778/g.93262 Transcript_35778/m.93262 type:complete len:154 (-) Transcript_35778:99-560(-)